MKIKISSHGQLLFFSVFCSALVFYGLFLFFHNQRVLAVDFCGVSTLEDCDSTSDCQASGCFNVTCQTKPPANPPSEGLPIPLDCAWQDCFDVSVYNLQCVCAEEKCQWQQTLLAPRGSRGGEPINKGCCKLQHQIKLSDDPLTQCDKDEYAAPDNEATGLCGGTTKCSASNENNWGFFCILNSVLNITIKF